MNDDVGGRIDTATYCPACGCRIYEVLNRVNCGRLRNGYLSSFGIDIGDLLRSAGSSIDLVRCTNCDVRWFTPLTPGDDKFYEGLQRQHWYYQDDKPEYFLTVPHIRPNDSILEVGCGKGAFASVLPAGTIYRGLEFNALAISKAKSLGLDVERKSIEDEASRRPMFYDVVCHFQVLEHVSDIHTFMAACIAAVKPGGRIFVTVPSEDSFLALDSCGWLNMPPHHVSRWTDKALLALAARHGLIETKIVHDRIADFHEGWYGSIMREHGLRTLLGNPMQLDMPDLAKTWGRRARHLPWLSRWLKNRAVEVFPHAKNGHSVTLIATRPPYN